MDIACFMPVAKFGPTILPVNNKIKCKLRPKALPMSWILNVSINKHAVHLGVNVLHSDLKAVEEPCLWHLHFTAETIYLHAANVLGQWHLCNNNYTTLTPTLHCTDCYSVVQKQDDTPSNDATSENEVVTQLCHHSAVHQWAKKWWGAICPTFLPWCKCFKLPFKACLHQHYWAASQHLIRRCSLLLQT